MSVNTPKLLRKLIKIFCENTHSEHEYEVGTTLQDVLKDLNLPINNPILGALVNNRSKELGYIIYKPRNVRFIDISSNEGMYIYERSLTFVLCKTVYELYPNAPFAIEHVVCNGIYAHLENKNIVLNDNDVKRIKAKMWEIIDADIPFTREEISTEEAIEIFEKQGMKEKTALLQTRGNPFTSIYSIGDYVDYLYSAVAPSSGVLRHFDLIPYYKGMLLMLPNPAKVEALHTFVPQPKRFKVLNEFKRWGKMMSLTNIGHLNRLVIKREIPEIIKISEALHEKKIGQIADKIHQEQKKIRLILISGPSSSGKTTFGKRLSIQLKAVGLQPVNLSLDNYFVDREDTPKDEHGEYDFERLEAIDVNLFNQHLLQLFAEKEVEIPKFSFEKGKKIYNGHKLQLKKRSILVVEGIHGLNPKLTPLVDPDIKFKLYIAALTTLSIDGHNRIPSNANRLIRRIIRDYKYRGYSARENIKRWESVRRGEVSYILPYQEEADVIFNTALPYELGVLKIYAEPILREVQPNCPEYSTAQRLLKFFSYFVPILPDEIPPTSILREFLGGSTFKY